ncbi:MAG TPA: tripartite tricarboxylate transporter substrate binding protein [Casimicrobiaceae bacterium]|nr:tripartite tricarboxylate transporter substrate binding protein [Casimicrobiaceae bacterium]
MGNTFRNDVRSRACRIIAATLLGSAALAAVTPLAVAQTYPARQIRFIVASSPGGTTDTLARRLGERVSKELGQPVVVENMPAASAVIAARTVAKAPADGYTVLIGTNTSHSSNPSMVKDPGYDPVADFAPVALLGLASLVITVHPSVQATTVKDLIAYAKANPGKLTFASGTGSARIAGEYFKSEAKVDIVSVPYKSNAQGMTDVIGGHVLMIFGDTPLVLPHIRSGAVRGIAVTSAQRSSLVPDLPTIKEAGLPNYELVGWVGAFVPAGTPPAVIQTLNEAIQKPLREKEFGDGLRAVGIEPSPSTPAQLAQFVNVELKRWGDIVRGAGIKPE